MLRRITLQAWGIISVIIIIGIIAPRLAEAKILTQWL